MLVTLVTGFGSAMGGSGTRSRARRKSGGITRVRKARGAERGTEAAEKHCFCCLTETWKGAASAWACAARRGISQCWQNYRDICKKTAGGAVKGEEERLTRMTS